MSSRLRAFHGLAALAVIIPLAALGASSASAAAAAPTATYRVGPITDISACGGQNAEVEQAVDAKLGYVYEEWMGCRGIAVARSTDGGRAWGEPVNLPDTVGSNNNTWDPAIAVAPDGTVYASFMLSRGAQYYPVVDASFDHGASFAQSSSLIPPDPKNWGDRDFIAVGPDGTVYVTWDYGPERTSITYICASNGSCAFGTGDLNVVMQKSVDGGKTWSRMSDISPGFPASGADSAPLVIEPDGRIDVLYQGYQVTNPVTYALSPAHSYFTSSIDGGATWSTPLAVGPQAGTMSLSEWWIDGDIGIDAAGNLYATWDTQGTNPDGSANDIGWLSFSTDHGTNWSAPAQAPADQLNVPHIMEVTGAGSGTAYVSWLSDSNPAGYALFLRAFSVTRGWLSAPVQITTSYGSSSVWPGDTTGLSALSPTDVVASWGSDYPDMSGNQDEIYAANIAAILP
ncbi:MAG TPA: sialidase family protein [Streptosporangiaceae bacterium]|nr:sialidase family protein [Streptosporangiaceae bacterium]